MAISVNARRLMTMNELVEYASIPATSKPMVYRWARLGHIPHIRIGRAVYFDAESIDQWIAAGGSRKQA